MLILFSITRFFTNNTDLHLFLSIEVCVFLMALFQTLVKVITNFFIELFKTCNIKKKLLTFL
jgi:hypothetical protein